MIVRAPGKVVLWGEYAVLTGAPAAVMAVDRYAAVTLHPDTGHHRFTSRGFLTPGVYKADGRFCRAPSAAMAEQVLTTLGYDSYPRSFSLCSDTAAFYSLSSGDQSGMKLGLGSSAALCVATYVALCRLLEIPAGVDQAIDIHRAFQGGKGSGLDVAASWHGGVVRFTQGRAQAWSWPEHLHWRAIWTGTSATTSQALTGFQQWLATRGPGALEPLANLCQRLFETPQLGLLRTYVDALRDLDSTAQLNIFTPEHQRLTTLAERYGLVYKPCGAGGGDIGIACCEDPQALDAFTRAARADSFVPLQLEISSHGVQAG